MNTESGGAVLKYHRGYTRLFITGIINGIGDRFSQVAMLSLVLHLTGSGLAVGISLGVRVLPFLLLAPLGGMLGGRLPRKMIMIATDLLRVPVALAFLWVDGPDKIWVIYAASFLLAAGEAIYSPIRKSSIPLLVNRERLLAVNGMEQLMMGIVLILGAFAGGVVSLWFGPQWAFILNAVSFLLAALLLAGIHFPQGYGSSPDGKQAQAQEEAQEHSQEHDQAQAQEQAQEHGQAQASTRSTPFSPSLRSVWSIVSGSVVLQIIFAFELLVPLVNGLDNVLISVYAVQEFGAGDLGVGAFYGALGIGLSLSFLAGRLLNKRLLLGALGGLLLEGILLIAISYSESFAAVFGLYILLAFTGGIGNACLDTLLMRETPVIYQPIIFGWLTAVSSTLLGLSMFGAGLVLETMKPRQLGLWGGAGFVCIALFLSVYAKIRMKKKKDGSITVPWKSL
ncbi:MFS transporter [Paenibacillus agri]|uniref:MFS transporter n=1 Tax=Paenibacillus agri TaxID=2744309 RepID=A0A850EQ08_9BACL|nr:MFS transporter [Paenibacillus agri]NUU61617.1 MFS transporter [Paenibacillus agri]